LTKVDIKGAQQWSAECHLEILGNLPDKPLEWELPYEQLSALLVLADLTAKSHMRLRSSHLKKYVQQHRS
jgi:hypothetical protein